MAVKKRPIGRSKAPSAQPSAATSAVPRPANLTEIGVHGGLPGSTWDTFSLAARGAGSGTVALSNSSDGVPLEDLREMRRRDAQTRLLLRMFTYPVLSCLKEARWVAPVDGGGEKETEFANLMFDLPPQEGGMTVQLPKLFRQILLHIFDGFAAFEEVRHIPDRGPLKGKVTLRKLAYRDARTVKFLVDASGGFDGFRQVASRPNGQPVDVVIPRERAWYVAAHEEESPMYGVSWFETSWYHYDIKKKLYFIANLAAQFAAVPGRIGEYPENASLSQRKAFQAALESFAFNTAMTHPAGFKVSPFNGSGSFNFLDLIAHHNRMQAKSVLQSFAENDDRMVLIDNGKADASADLFIVALTAIMDEIADTLTMYLMPKYIDWNFGTGKYPKFVLGTLAESTKESLQAIFSTVVSSSVLNCTPEFVRETEKALAASLDLDIDYDEIEAHEKAAAEAQAEEEALLAEQQDAQPQQGGAEPPAGAQGGTDGQPEVSPASGPPTGAQGSPGGQPAGPAVALAGIDDLVAMAVDLFAVAPEQPPVSLED